MTAGPSIDIALGVDTAGMAGGFAQARQQVQAAAATIRQNMDPAKESMGQAGLSVQQLARETQRMKDEVAGITPAMRRYSQELLTAKAALDAGALTQQEYARAVELSEQRLDAFNATQQRSAGVSGQVRGGMQQLSYQVNDVATMFALGAKPMQIFASQGGQVAQAIGLMTAGSKGLIGFLGGPWGLAIMSATTVLGSLIFANRDAAGAADSFTDALRRQEGAANDAAGALQRLQALQKSTLAGDVILVEMELNKLRDRRSELELDIQKRSRGLTDNSGRPLFSYAQQQELRGVEQDIVKLEGDIRRGQHAIEQHAKAEQESAAATEGATRASSQRSAGLSVEAKARQQAFNETENYISALGREIEKLTLSEEALRDLEVRRALETAQTADQVKAILDEAAAREKALAAKEREKQLDEANKALDQYRKDTIPELDIQLQTMELVGAEREREINRLRHHIEMEEYKAKADAAEAAGLGDVATAWRAVADAAAEAHAKRQQGVDISERLNDEALAARALNDQLRDMVDLLDSVGGAGQVLGSLLAVATGDFRGVASGPAGDILSYVLNQPTGNMIERNGQKVAEVLGHKLEDVFGSQGIFGKTLVEALQAAGLGYAAANAMGVGSGAASGFLSSAGGLFGEIAGEKLLGKLLGSFAGPVGSILGGIAGGLIGSLFGGADKGVIGISGSAGVLGTFGTKHGSAEQLAAATQAANGLIDAMGRIASELGGTLNAGAAGRLTLGMRDDDWVLDPTGQGRTKGTGVINFGPDQEAAVKAAMKLLIDRGVIGGLRESTMNLLKNASDLEQGLQDALAFEGVFRALEAQANPFAAALRELGQQMDHLTGVFQRAGATAEEYAQLQQYIAMQQQALIDQASATYRSTFYSDAENVAFAKQTISASLTPLGYGNVDTVAEYKALVEATDALANPELYGALMELADEFGVLKDAAEAAAAQQAAERAQREAQQAQREAELRAAWQRERSEFEQTAEAYRQHAERLRDWRRELLAGADATTGYAQRLAHLRKTFEMARLGDEKALSALPGAGNDFLASALKQSRTEADYRMAVAMVANMAQQAAAGADAMVSEAEQQIALLDRSVGKLIDIDEGVKSVAQLIREWRGGGAGGAGSAAAQAALHATIQRMQARGRGGRGLDALIDRYEARYGEYDPAAAPPSAAMGRGEFSGGGGASMRGVEDRLDRLDAALRSIAVHTGRTSQVLDDADRGGRLAFESEA